MPFQCRIQNKELYLKSAVDWSSHTHVRWYKLQLWCLKGIIHQNFLPLSFQTCMTLFFLKNINGESLYNVIIFHIIKVNRDPTIKLSWQKRTKNVSYSVLWNEKHYNISLVSLKKDVWWRPDSKFCQFKVSVQFLCTSFIWKWGHIRMEICK